MLKLNKKQITRTTTNWKRKSRRLIKRTSKSIKRQNLGLKLGIALVLVGISIVGFTIFKTWLSQKSGTAPISQVLKSNQQTNKDPLISGTPVRIQLPSVGIDLKVIPGYYYPSTKSWTLSLDDAQWGVMTAKPNNQGGDTFIYAHYRWHVFYTLPKVKAGDAAIVTTENGHTFTYSFRESTVTNPGDTRLFGYKGKPILILQTCTGVWYQNRQLFVFDLSGVA